MTHLQYLQNVSTLRLNTEKCTGCEECLRVCPHGVFKKGARIVEIVAPDDCMECGACQRNCRFGAISVNAGVGCAAAIIGSVLSPGSGCDC
jgi:NAD-dependent dihydropyrimidine dehydrogenase PreA subunit